MEDPHIRVHKCAMMYKYGSVLINVVSSEVTHMPFWYLLLSQVDRISLLLSTCNPAI